MRPHDPCMSWLKILLLLVLIQLCCAKSRGSGTSAATKQRQREKAAAEKKAKDEKACMDRQNVCTGVTPSVGKNVARALPCVESNPCMVVVNDRANSTTLCNSWTPYSFWDGEMCMARCELLKGRFTTPQEGEDLACIVENTIVVGFDAYVSLNDNFDSAFLYDYPVNYDYFIAPIKCGTWLGVRESSEDTSRFTSTCFAILENKIDIDSIAVVRPCGINGYTKNCRILGYEVPECRTNDADECGVMVDSKALGGFPPACPEIKPCLGETLESNIGKGDTACFSTTYLALNVWATADNCSQWRSESSFLLDGRCVSSCGTTDYQCTINGAMIPPCTKPSNGNSEYEIRPDICSVPMRADRFSGVRNGYFGMSEFNNSKCFYSTDCTNASLCTTIEGVQVSVAQDWTHLPTCRGNVSQMCKIAYPCPVVPTFNCDRKQILGVSQAIYTRMGVYNCDWFFARDVIIYILWVVTILSCCSWCSANTEQDNSPFEGNIGLPDPCVYFCTLLGLLGLSCIWEFFASIICVTMLCMLVKESLYTRIQADPENENQQGVRRVMDAQQTMWPTVKVVPIRKPVSTHEEDEPNRSHES